MNQVGKQNHEMMDETNSEFLLENDVFKKARQKGTYYWIIKRIFYGKNKGYISLFILFNITAAYLNSIVWIVIGEALEKFSQGKFDQIWYYTFIAIFLGIGIPLTGLLSNFSREILAQRLERDVRREFYLNLLGKSQSFHDNERLGDLMARATNDVRYLNFLISPGISLIFTATVNLIIPIVLSAYYYSIQLMIIPISFSLLFIIYLRGFIKKIGTLTLQRQTEFGNMNASLNESLAGIEIVKSMAMEKESIDKYKQAAVGYRDTGIKEGEVMARYLPFLLLAFTIVFSLIHAIILESQGILTMGDVIGYVGLVYNFRIATGVSTWAFLLLKQATAGTDRLIETMNKSSEISELPEAINLDQFKGKITFENVSFNYPGTLNKVLKNINLEILPGQTVAIVGTTGSGKSTFTKLISRLYDVSEGRILLDGKDIRSLTLKSLREQIAYIEQDIFLFSKSVSENISFGRDCPEGDIINVAMEAQAHDFILNLPQKYNSQVGERGVQLSGGERQRIAIARAFLSDPRILILDDSSSAIDSETEEKIHEAISRILRGRTTFIITHRLSQIRWADKILVFKRGEIIAQGSHRDLLKNSSEYRKIFIKRFDKTLSELLGGEE